MGHREGPCGVGVLGVLPQVRGSPRHCVREPADHQEVPHAKLLRRHVGGIDGKDPLSQREGEVRHAGVVQRTRKRESRLHVPGCVLDSPDPLGDGLLVLAEIPVHTDEGHSCPGTGLVEIQGFLGLQARVRQGFHAPIPAGEVLSPSGVSVERMPIGEVRARPHDALQQGQARCDVGLFVRREQADRLKEPLIRNRIGPRVALWRTVGVRQGQLECVRHLARDRRKSAHQLLVRQEEGLSPCDRTRKLALHLY
jgi:hypothetical protein